MMWSCDLVRSTSTTTMMNEISKNAACIMRYLESKLQLNPISSHYSCNSRIHIAPIWLWNICLVLHAHLIFTVSWAGLYITGRQLKCFWHVNVGFHFTSCHWFQIFQPFCSIGHIFHQGHNACILPLPIVISFATLLRREHIFESCFLHPWNTHLHESNKCIVTESASLTRSYPQLHAVQIRVINIAKKWYDLSSVLNREPPDIRSRAIPSLFE